MAAPQFPWVSVEEYLEQEALSDTKHSYYAGTVLAMAGGTFAHGRLAGNLFARIHAHIEDSDCAVVGSDVLFQTARKRLYSYPDVMVVCGPVETVPGRPTVVTNPVFVAEVLSPSTAAFDRGEKAEEYRQSPTVRAIALLSPDRAKVELYSRGEDGRWLVTDVEGLETEVVLECLQCRIPMAALYKGVLGNSENLTQS